MIRALPNIEIDDPSAELILDSLHPEVKQRQIQIRNKLKLVW
jgi:translation initiation factor 3 subunit A